MEIKGKIALVTGASSGIGWTTALALAREGCRVAIAARRADKLKELAKQLAALGAESIEAECDIRDRAHAQRLVDAALEKWGRVDILVNNAGILNTAPFHKQDIAVIEDIMRTNYLGCVYALQAALVPMRKQGRGHIVNVASVAGLMGFPSMGAYCASKWALVGLTEALRREYYGTGITLTAFCPGMVDTPMAQNSLRNPELLKRFKPKTPEQCAAKIVAAIGSETPEIVYGELPELVVKLTKFFPRLADWAAHRAAQRLRVLTPALQD